MPIEAHPKWWTLGDFYLQNNKHYTFPSLFLTDSLIGSLLLTRYILYKSLQNYETEKSLVKDSITIYVSPHPHFGAILIPVHYVL